MRANSIRQLKKEDIEKFKKIREHYSERASEDNLNALLDLYEQLIPNWVQEFNNFSRELSYENTTNNKIFDDFLSVELPSNYSIENLKAPQNKDENSFIDIMQRGRIIHLSNKLAHYVDYLMDTKIAEYMRKNEIPFGSRENFDNIKKYIKRTYHPSKCRRQKEDAMSRLIAFYNFESADFEKGKNLDSLNLGDSIWLYNKLMYIKDTEIENVNSLVVENNRNDISYGLKEVDEDNTLFVMDIQKFGQFSVHVKSEDLKAKIKEKYTMPIYNRKTNMLTNYMSNSAIEFIEEVKSDNSGDREKHVNKFWKRSRKERRRLTSEIGYLDLSRKEKHEIAVKAGLIKRDLEELEREDDR